MFKEIILRRDLCTWIKGMDIKMKMSSLESWARKPDNKEWIGESYKELDPVKELTLILTLDKGLMTSSEMRKEICPSLNLVQVKQILSIYQADESIEMQVPISTIQFIVAEEGYNLDDQLLFDPNYLLPINMDLLHYIEMEDFERIPFPKNDFERFGR